jgi:hypothetical protein
MTHLKTIAIAIGYYVSAFTFLQYVDIGLKIAVGGVTLFLLLRKKKDES